MAVDNVFDTKSAERALLKILTTQQMLARAHFHRVKAEWFTSKPRQFVFSVALRVFDDSKSLLSQKLFDFELVNAIKEADRSHYVAEWNMICGEQATETVDALIEQLGKVERIGKVSDICERVINHLDNGDVDDAVSVMKHESLLLGTRYEDRPTHLFTDYTDRRALIHDKKKNPRKYLGTKTGFDVFDKRTGGLFPNEMTLIAALTGVGKSTVMKQWEAGIVLSGKNCLHVTNEESQEQVLQKFDAIITDMPYLDFKLATIDEAAMEDWEGLMVKVGGPEYGSLFVKEIPPYVTIAEVERAYLELEQKGHKIDVVFLDYMDHMSPLEKAWSENDEQGKVAVDCKGLAIALRVPLVTATQAATGVETKQEKGRRFGGLDVYGSKRKVHEANTFLGIIRHASDEDEDDGGWESDVEWTVYVAKNRDGPKFSFDVVHHVRTGRVDVVGQGSLVDRLLGLNQPANPQPAKKAVPKSAVPKKAVKKSSVPKKAIKKPKSGQKSAQ